MLTVNHPRLAKYGETGQEVALLAASMVERCTDVDGLRMAILLELREVLAAALVELTASVTGEQPNQRFGAATSAMPSQGTDS